MIIYFYRLFPQTLLFITDSMSDPDQDEMRRKRLARLSAMGGTGGDRPAASTVVNPVPAAPVIIPAPGVHNVAARNASARTVATRRRQLPRQREEANNNAGAHRPGRPARAAWAWRLLRKASPAGQEQAAGTLGARAIWS